MATPITPALLQGAFTNFNTAFQRGFTGVQPWWTSLATLVPSATEAEVHAWLQMMPAVREWIGPRTVNRLAANAYRLPNKDYEHTFGVSRNKFEDDLLGVYAPALEMQGFQFAKWPDYQLVDLLKNFLTKLCWDGLTFFNTAHPVDFNNAAAGTFSNLLTLALTAANFETAYAAMAAFPREDGQPMGLLPTELIVPPALRSTAMLIAQAGLVGNTAGTASQTNPNQGIVTVRVIPELAGDDTAWYLGVMNMPIKPLVYQLRKAPVFQAFTNITDENVFMHKEFIFGADARAAFGYTIPQLMLRSKP
jgi:phage major head subunit gpT-like protein